MTADCQNYQVRTITAGWNEPLIRISGPFGPGLGDDLSAFQVVSATFADHPVATPAWLQIMIGTWTWVTIVPNVSLMVRRLHDANFSGFWALLGFVPPGALVLVIMAWRSSRQTGARFDRPWRGSAAPRQRLAP
ncbi:MAG: hypothetical protein QOF79_170 [Actinomycetota bacterium]|nr:hypothetical protein [Actinomycetota bacterium]